jgi:phosphoribosylanthranilate isomerase
VNAAEVDYAGFVFTSHRQQISLETAKSLKNALNPAIKSVGVFINEPFEFVQSVVESGVVDAVQFHGDCEYPLPVLTIKAVLVGSQLEIKPSNCDFVLFDTLREGERGSTGGMFDWQLIKDYAKNPPKPFFLAGGINAFNLLDAIKFKPYCIDVSSGVEINEKKCYNKIKELSLCIKKCFQN